MAEEHKNWLIRKLQRPTEEREAMSEEEAKKYVESLSILDLWHKIRFEEAQSVKELTVE